MVYGVITIMTLLMVEGVALFDIYFCFLLALSIRFYTWLVENQRQCSSVMHTQTEQMGEIRRERLIYICAWTEVQNEVT